MCETIYNKSETGVHLYLFTCLKMSPAIVTIKEIFIFKLCKTTNWYSFINEIKTLFSQRKSATFPNFVNTVHHVLFVREYVYITYLLYSKNILVENIKARKLVTVSAVQIHVSRYVFSVSLCKKWKKKQRNILSYKQH